MMGSVKHLQTPLQAIRRAQADIICRSRRSIKPSTEILQIAPDLLEIFNETQPHRTGQRRRKKLHWALLPRSLNLWSRSPLCGMKGAAACAHYSTQVQTLQETPVTDVTQASRSKEGTALNVCEKSNLHHVYNEARCSSLEEKLTSLQSNPDVISVQRLDQAQVLVEEVNRRKLQGKPVPDSVNSLDLDHLLNLQSKTARKRFLNFLVRKEKLKHKRTENKASRCKLKVFQDQELTCRNTFVRRGQSVAEAAADTWNLARSLMFGPPIVFDLSYDHHMDRGEIINTVLQLNLVLKTNKLLRDPFHVHLASVAKDGHAEQELKRVHGRHFGNLMVSITEERPQHIFPNDQLLYLTADSPNTLIDYDPSKVYVIGGFVDRCVKSRVSLGKAEAAGIPHARLPLDEHLQWHKSTKNLTLDQMMSILSELRLSGDWVRALQHVPSRKHLGHKLFQSDKPKLEIQ